MYMYILYFSMEPEHALCFLSYVVYCAMRTAGTQIYAAKQNVIDPNLYPIYRTSTDVHRLQK